MNTGTTQLKTLNLSVYDSIQVADVFGAVKTFVDRVQSVARSVYKVVEAIVKIAVLEVIFSGLNNHSSPPSIVFNRLNTSKKIARN